MKITADTITDEQIRELRAELADEHARAERDYMRARSTDSRCNARDNVRAAKRGVDHCDVALSGDRIRARVARARCAEILEARRSKP